VREIVIVLADLHPPADLESLAPGVLHGVGPGFSPGLEQVVRFAASAALPGGWRSWVARRLDLTEYADRPPASVAAAAAGVSAAPPACWLAAPLHLIEGLTRVHVDWGSLLRLPRAERDRLATDFKDAFRGSGFDLSGLECGGFLLTAPPLAPVRTVEPARVLQFPLADVLPSGEGAAALRRLGSEIEMWLHAHPLNRERSRRGERPVSTLWIWGGGEPPAPRTASRPASVTVFAGEAYVRGLCRLAGWESRPAAQAAPRGDAGTPCTLCVLEVAEVLQSKQGMSFPEALAALDGRVIAPAVAALRRRRIDRLVLLANDRLWTLHGADRLRFWRRRRSALEALA
jgi:hypothetical protein